MPKLVLRQGDPDAQVLMRPTPTRVPAGWCAEAVRAAVAAQPVNDDPWGPCEIVVVDDAGRFLGLVGAAALAEAAPLVDVATLATVPAYTARVTTPLEELAIAIDRYHLDAIPVLSEHRRPIGIISAPSVLAAILHLNQRQSGTPHTPG